MQSNFPECDTPRLHLREIMPSDADALFAVHSDVSTMRWFGIDPLTERQQAVQMAAMFAGWFASGSGIRWAITLREGNVLVGTCGFFRWNKSWRNCLIGFELRADLHRRGYMAEAVRAILNYGFMQMDLHRIQAECHPDNHASIGLLQQQGFRFEGVHRQQARWGGRFHDLRCYALLAPERLVVSDGSPNH